MKVRDEASARVIDVTTFNIRGAKGMQHTIRDLSRRAHVVGLCETWHNANDNVFKSLVDEEVAGPRAEGALRGSGGVALVVHPLMSYKVLAKHVTKCTQFIAVRTGSVMIAMVYLSPSATDDESIDVINRIANLHRGEGVIMGDLNARHTNWDHATNRRGRRLIAWARRRSWDINGPDGSSCRTNRGSSSPDLIMTKRCQSADTRCLPGAWQDVSDHVPVAATIKATPLLLKQEKRIAPKLRSIDAITSKAAQVFKAELPRHVEAIKAVQTADQLEKAYADFRQTMLKPWESARRSVPGRYKSHWTKGLDWLAKQRAKAYRKARRSRKVEDWAEHDKLDKLVKRGAKKEKQRRLARISEMTANTSSKESISRAISTARAIKGKKGKKRHTDLHMADFTDHMTTPVDQRWCPPWKTFKVPHNFAATIATAIGKSKPRKAEGEDELFVDAFKLATQDVSEVLAWLWQKCTDTRHILQDWKMAVLVPLYKKGDTTKPASYRPIALMSHARKVVDAAIAIQIRREYRFHQTQLGFQPETGTETAIVRHIDKGRRLPIAAVLDLKGAYDNIPRDKLVTVLEQRLTDTTAAMVTTTLRPGRIRTKGDASQRTGTVSRGVEQGSPSSPTIFNIYMDTLAERLERAMTTFAQHHPQERTEWSMTMFADDVKFQTENRATMQGMLDAASQWASTMGMLWAPSKCSVICAQPNTTEVGRLTLGGEKLKEERETVYLGVSIDGRKTTTTKSVERMRQAAQLARCLRQENVNTASMCPKALRNVAQSVLVSVASYGVHLCPMSKETEKEWKVLEEEIGKMTLGVDMSDRLATMRMMLKVPSLCELQRMRRDGLRKRIERNARGERKTRESMNDPKALRMARAVLRAPSDLSKEDWWTAMGRGCKQKKRPIPHRSGETPPILRLRNAEAVRRCTRWYGGTFPPNVESIKRSGDARTGKLYQEVAKLMEQRRWTEVEEGKVVRGMKQLKEAGGEGWRRRGSSGGGAGL